MFLLNKKGFKIRRNERYDKQKGKYVIIKRKNK